jgi:hypothetical protein
MIIIGVDFHPEFQQIAWVDTESGEFQEQRLAHREDAEKFYRGLAAAGQKVRVGMEASGQTGEFYDALPAGGSGPGDGTQRARVAQQVSAPDDAAGAENRQGSDGPQAGGSSVLDVAARVELRAVEQVRFARGTARTSRWCASNTEKLIGYPAPLHRGVRSSNHDRSCRPKRCMGRTESPDLRRLQASLRWNGFFIESEMARFSECMR